MANLPVLPTLYDDPDMLAAMPSAEIFIDALKKENGIQYATIADLSQYRHHRHLKQASRFNLRLACFILSNVAGFCPIVC